MKPGDSISILISGAACHSAVVTRFLHGMVEQETEKAVCVRAESIYATGGKGPCVWIPKKALIPSGSTFKLAKWFKGDEYFWNVVEEYENIGGVSCA